MSRRDKQFLKGLVVLGVILSGVAYTTRLSPCLSESLKGVQGILALRSANITRGDIVFIKEHTTSLSKGRNFAKRVVGLPGDRIEIEGDQLHVAGHANLKVHVKSLSGKDLHPTKAHEIPEGYIFVAGDHDRSFDSRYQEFGLVPLAEVWGKAVLTW